MTHKTPAQSPIDSLSSLAPRMALCASAVLGALGVLSPMAARADESGTATIDRKSVV